MYETIAVSNRKGNGFNDLTGQRFGRLTVLGLSDKKSGRKSYWVCKCDCGELHVVRSDSLKGGRVRSCGCLKVEQDERNLYRDTHGDTHVGQVSRLWHTWQGMKQRCENPNDRSYDGYGGRGIRVCQEWHSYETFKAWALSKGYTDALTIERKDVNGNYEPENCTWIPFEEQANNRRSTVWIEWNGKVQNLKQWADELGINYGTLHTRFRRYGFTPPELFRPVRQYQGNTEVNKRIKERLSP